MVKACSTPPGGATAPPIASSILPRIWRRWQYEGWHGLATRACERARWHLWEWRWGIDTRGSIPGELLGHDEPCFGYQPVPYRTLEAVFAAWDLDATQEVFLDYGCGKGRALLQAARYPFQRILGIESSASLHAIAQQNVARAVHRLRCRHVDVLLGDAAAFPLPDDVTIIFLFNPFAWTVLQRVAAQWWTSWQRVPRTLRIIHTLPSVRPDGLSEIPWLRPGPDVPDACEAWQQLRHYQVIPREDAAAQATPDFRKRGCE